MTPYSPKKIEDEKIQPKEVRKIGNRELKVVWSDNHTALYSSRWLRQNCPCASCVDEWSGKPLLEREKVSKDIEGLKVNIVGQYALSVDFSDGHTTGIYSFKFLRKICPCEICIQQEKK